MYAWSRLGIMFRAARAKVLARGALSLRWAWSTGPLRASSHSRPVQLRGVCGDSSARGEVDEAPDLERLGGAQDVLQVGVVHVDLPLHRRVSAAAILI